ncbi:RNA polymerase sigma factor [Phenylobacterium sp.]|uniref:RNA polymerase sigma factor n=1 Tax=Phenylobacterium sp. TaxID=1871053 RepID=UPI002FC6B324
MANDRRSTLIEDLNQAYRERGARLREIAARGGRDDASDLVHDAIVKTLEAGQKSDVRDPVRFLFRVTRNTLLDRFRTRTRRGRVLEYGLDDADATDPGVSPERAVIASERLSAALAAIDKMPPRRREAFLLCRVEELTYAEAGRRMGVSVHAIEKLMSAAMAQLFEEFDTDGDLA